MNTNGRNNNSPETAFLYLNFAENSVLWRRGRTPRACVKQHRTDKGRFEFFASVSQELLTTQTELLVGTPPSVDRPDNAPSLRIDDDLLRLGRDTVSDDNQVASAQLLVCRYIEMRGDETIKPNGHAAVVVRPPVRNVSGSPFCDTHAVT